MPDDRSPEAGHDREPALPVDQLRLTDTQRQILLALCRPCIGESRYTTPATNQQIAAEVYLSVDAVKAHLRALYRKFGVEPLPHNQKRARLVELVLEGGVLPAAAQDGGTTTDAAPRPAGAPPPPPVPRGGRRRPSRRTLVGSAIAIGVLAVVAAGGVILSGGSGGDSAAKAPTKAEYVAAVNRYCRLALGPLARIGEKRLEKGTTAERAATYLSVIETMRGRLASLDSPPGKDRALERFRAGLRTAANFTGLVAEGPPEPGSARGANVVAELTFAAGQVQAGALGYGLGSGCTAIGNVVAGSARNAAGAL